MRVIFISSMVLALSGCVMNQQDAEIYQKEKNFDSIKHQLKAGGSLSVSDLKSRYKSETGRSLFAPLAALCKTDDACYYNEYAEVYDRNINEYRLKKEQEEAALKNKKDDEACQKDSFCSFNKKRSHLSLSLRQEYGTLLSILPYNQSEADLVFRTICSASSSAYSKGYSRKEFINNLKDAPGIGPQERYLSVEIAQTCWDITSIGLNWNEILRQ